MRKVNILSAIFAAIIVLPAAISAGERESAVETLLASALSNNLTAEAGADGCLVGIPDPSKPANTGKDGAYDPAVDIIRNEFKLDKISIDIDASDVASQSENPKNSVGFEQALRSALNSFMNDGHDAESPLGLVLEDADSFFYQQGNHNPSGEQLMEKAKEMLFALLNDPGTKIRLYNVNETPEYGESVSDNWVFSLYIGNYTDDGHWAIVNRADGSVYNYGFN